MCQVPFGLHFCFSRGAAAADAGTRNACNYVRNLLLGAWVIKTKGLLGHTARDLDSARVTRHALMKHTCSVPFEMHVWQGTLASEGPRDTSRGMCPRFSRNFLCLSN